MIAWLLVPGNESGRFWLDKADVRPLESRSLNWLPSTSSKRARND